MLHLSTTAARRRRLFLSGSLLFTALLAGLAALPSFRPGWLPFLQPLTIDTDPENMLSEDEPVRIGHDRLKRVFDIHDFVVVGVVNPEHEQGVFNAKDLGHVHRLTERARGLSYRIRVGNDTRAERVIAEDVIAPSTVDNIETGGLGSVSFSWLMRTPPATDAEAARIRDQALRIPMYRGTLVSEDGRALGLYFPISHKKISHRLEQDLRDLIATFEDTGAEYHITGLPVAEDRFGTEMFYQMAVSAPLALAFVFALLWAFFRHVRIILISLLAAMISVVCTMSLLVISGQTVHIMSSMIPIFIIPIAVLDDIHILSDFYDKYQPDRDRLEIVDEVMDSLWRPMWYTTLTTAAGFASLLLTPIPPVQVFGAFVAVGVLLAWFFTVTLLPAYFMMLPDAALKGFGARQRGSDAGDGAERSWLGRGLRAAGPGAGRHAASVIGVSLGLVALAVVGILRIRVNDNPIKWFDTDHEIRVADRVFNDRFAGSYMAYLHLQPARDDGASETPAEPFKQPGMLEYLSSMRETLAAEVAVLGKVSGLGDIVKTVHRELLGQPEAFRIPDSAPAVAQTILTFQNSHRPDDVYTFVDPSYEEAALWFQLRSGDNRDMGRVERAVERHLQDTPPPSPLESGWFGLTYINLVWQEKMVTGMLKAFLGSFVVVALLSSLLFRSPAWGLLAMVPLTVTVVLIYGAVGWVGKDYDMPTAVLSSLSLGLAVDYAIHFLARSREIFGRSRDWRATLEGMYEEPARAITRNVIVVGVGFLPLLAAHLVPYRTVGTLISAILVLAGAATLILLPALMTPLHRSLFRRERRSS